MLPTKITNIVLTVNLLLLFACNTVLQKETVLDEQVSFTKADTVALKVALQQIDTANNEDFAILLNVIRQNVVRIDSIAKWTSTINKELNESLEGGEATFYYISNGLEKIVTQHFGETFQKMTGYYLLNGLLSYVFEKTSQYNRPIYYDSVSMKENNDNQIFDFKKSEIVEQKSYFDKGKLIHKSIKHNGSSPLANSNLFQEQKRILEVYNKFKTMTNKK